MQRLARRTSQAGASAQIGAVDWAAGRLRLSFEAEGTVDPGGDPVTLVRRGSRLLLDPAWTEGLGVDPMDATDDVADCRATVSVRIARSASACAFPERCQMGPPDTVDGPPRTARRRAR